jgi:hypothetical protein
MAFTYSTKEELYSLICHINKKYYVPLSVRAKT